MLLKTGGRRDTSHVIAEIIGTSIDKQLRDACGGWPNGFRYVDDFYLFFNSRVEAEKALSAITKIVASHELQINAQKTRIIETRELVEESWKYKLKNTEISEGRLNQRTDLHRFFEMLISLEKAYKDESIAKYGLKAISTQIIKKSNWEIYESYLLNCGFSYPNTLQVIASILITYNAHSYPLDRKALTRFCNSIIQVHARSENHSEVAWALWIMIELRLSLHEESVDALSELTSSVCLLLALTVLRETRSKYKISQIVLSKYASQEALYKEGWLLSYEGGTRRWLGNIDTAYILANDFFGPLAKNKISFYNDKLRLPLIFRLKDASVFDENLFESDEDIADFFDYQESDEEYFDSQVSGDLDDHSESNEFEDSI